MEIELHQIRVADVFEGYKDSQIEGVVAYGGKLDVRPRYQREFVYKDAQRDAVIDTVIKGFPLNVMYWVKKDDGNFEVLDGQQRTLSICQFLNHDFSINFNGQILYEDSSTEILEMIKNYELMVYICEGSDMEKLEWFKTVNISGERLFDQEIRNAVYSGEWLTKAKRYFSKPGCAGKSVSEKYVVANVVRQELLELAISWISMKQGKSIEEYMAAHQHDAECTELWDYFNEVLEWIPAVFVTYRKEMMRVKWGELYYKYGNGHYKPLEIKEEVDRLMADEDVTNKSGIYTYIFTHDEKNLNIRSFSQSEKRQKYEEQGGICPVCGEHYKIEEMEADHIVAWSDGGKTRLDNCQMLCKDCNRKKGNK